MIRPIARVGPAVAAEDVRVQHGQLRRHLALQVRQLGSAADPVHQRQPPGGWLPRERVTFEQALAGFTRGAAYASFAEGKIGSLEPGKWADFIIVDRDVSMVDPQSLGRTKVLETWIAGNKVWTRK